MDIGILKITNCECVSDAEYTDTRRVSYELGKHGYLVKCVFELDGGDKVLSVFGSLCSMCEAVVVCGDTEIFFDAVGEKYDINRRLSTFLIGETPCAVSKTCDDGFVRDKLIPMLNGRCKTYYATSVFRTVGKTEEQLRAALKDYIKNRNKIVFKFVSDPPECTVLVRYSNKTQKNTVNEILAGVATVLSDCTYSYSDTTLCERVARILTDNNKTLGLAESFTGGAIAASLVKIPGISKSFKEGIVCYDSSVKNSRLRVPQTILDNYGAVSIETAYEMAANLIADGGYDYVVATTGNAGPTSEKPDQVGVCYIAVGDKDNIDIYPCRFEGDRQKVIDSGVKTALYYLYLRIANDARNAAESENKE